MKQMIIILLCTVSISICAADLPSAYYMSTSSSAMTSVNQSSYMTTGSKYTSSVHEVGASSPVAHAPSKPRKTGGPGGTDDGSYNPQPPQFGSIGGALIPLLIMVLIYAMVLYRRKSKESCL